jgi:hypothetical protein
MTIKSSRQSCVTIARLSGSLTWSSLDSFRGAQGLEAGAQSIRRFVLRNGASSFF